MTEPITFTPLYQERVWGGRTLETLYHRPLPQNGAPFGESWEIVDRDPEQSVVTSGPLAGLTLHDLWTQRREEVFGKRLATHPAPRFPVLVKILDARDTLSIQVHPPAALAPQMGGEPKTEMWVIVHAEPGASLYAGLAAGTTRESFEKALADGTVEQEVHRLPVKTGDFLFLPSGRLHAIGAGLLIFEIQQNSDTTYRVFDFNRLGLDGKPRALHVAESLACIDFTDTEPGPGVAQGDTLARCDYFQTNRRTLAPGASSPAAADGECAIIAVVSGALSCGGRTFAPGDFFLVSAAQANKALASAAGAEYLQVTLP